MIRKAVIVVLTLATAATLYAGYVGFGSPPSTSSRWNSWPEFPFEGSGTYVTWTVDDALTYVRRQQVTVRSGGGKLGIVWKRYKYGTGPTYDSGWSWGLPLIRCGWWWETALMPHPLSSLLLHGQLLSVLMSVWIPAILFATYPTVAFVRGPLRRWRRRRKGQCLDCGYDLTGNLSGTCPECGSPVDHG